MRRIGIVKGPGVIAPLVMDCLERALRELGHEVRCVSPMGAGPGLRAMLEELVRARPEVVLSYGCTGVIPDVNGPFFRTQGVPLALLHYDCPFFVISPAQLEEFRAHPEAYRHYVWDEAFRGPLAQLGVANLPIMLAADERVFSPRAPSHRFEVTFVGRGGDIAGPRRQRREKFPAALNRFVDEVIARKVAEPSVPTLAHWASVVQDGFPEMGVDWRAPATAALYLAIHREGSTLLRQKVLGSVRAARPDAFGKGWESLPNVNSHAEVDYVRELPAVYADSRINLNVTSVQLESSVNNRVFDVAAVGGFLLTDFREDLLKVFPDFGKMTWRTLDELNEKIEYFLSHESERRELARAVQEAVLAEHTWAHRARYLLESLGLGG